MYKVPTIQKIISVIMICILVVSITPVSLYHDLLSDHTDSSIQLTDSGKTEIGIAGINCHIDGFVADKNYTFSISSVEFKCPVVTCFYVSKPVPDFYSQHHFYAELRGPPAVV